MSITAAKLTILFQEPFWIGLYERESDNHYEVCKITFGSEPKDYQVYDYLLSHWHNLRFSPLPASGRPAVKKLNPKRMHRDIKKQLKPTGVGTKAQQALKLQQEEGRLSRRQKTREQKEAEKELKFKLKQQKHKDKHRGH